MTSSKVVILVLVLIAVFFALSVAVGVRNDRQEHGTVSQSSLATSLANLFVTTKSLQPSDIKTNCLQVRQFVVAHGSCTANIVESRAAVRKSTLTLVEGNAVGIDFKPNDQNSLAVNKTLRSGEKPFEFQVFKEGADLTLTCEPASPLGHCTVQLGP